MEEKQTLEETVDYLRAKVSAYEDITNGLIEKLSERTAMLSKAHEQITEYQTEKVDQLISQAKLHSHSD